MDKEQIIALAEKAKLFVVRNGDCDVEDLRRFLEAYKAELLNEACEPVAKVEQHARMTSQSTTLDRALRAGTTLYTSDQVAAAIIKATKPLEERRCEICGYAEHHREHTSCLRTQLAAAQEEINEWRGKHDVACLTITKLQKQYEIQLAATSKAMGAEESLLIVNYQLAKAEQGAMEWQPIETAPKDGTVFLAWRKHATHPLMVRYEPSYDWFANYDGEHVYDLTHWMPLPKAPNDASS